MKGLFIAETKLDSFCRWSIVVCLNYVLRAAHPDKDLLVLFFF